MNDFRNFRVNRMFFVVAVISLVGCAWRPLTPSGKLRFDERKIFAAGDCFQLVVRGHSIDEAKIGGDGTIVLPLVGERVKVAELTSGEVRKLICESYRPDGPSEREVEVLSCRR